MRDRIDKLIRGVDVKTLSAFETGRLKIVKGDVVLEREPASVSPLTEGTRWRHRVHVQADFAHGALADTVYATYEEGLKAAEHLAATRRARLRYRKDGALSLLKDHRRA